MGYRGWTLRKAKFSALARALVLNGSLTSVTCQVENIRGDDDTLAATLALAEEDSEKQLHHDIWVDPLEPLRADAIFDGMSRELDKNRATLAKKGCNMTHSAVANKTLPLTVASKSLAKIGINVSVSTPSRQSEASRNQGY